MNFNLNLSKEDSLNLKRIADAIELFVYGEIPEEQEIPRVPPKDLEDDFFMEKPFFTRLRRKVKKGELDIEFTQEDLESEFDKEQESNYEERRFPDMEESDLRSFEFNKDQEEVL